MDTGLNSGIYKFLLVLHILAVVIGFGGVVLNALYGARAKKAGGREGLAVSEANFWVTERAAEPAIYAVFVLGILLVLASDEAWEFGDTWISVSMLLYIVGIALSHAVMRPAVKRMNALQAELAAAGPGPSGAGGPAPQVAQLESLGQRVGVTGAVLDVLLVIIIALMVWKPA
jgi:uncharacterized membrane protein